MRWLQKTMRLDILVPKYKEKQEDLLPLLMSIAYQQGCNVREDVRVLIGNDGGEYGITKDFMAQFPFKIIYSDGEHRGVSATRNRLLDLSDAEYIMCCDSDDMFINLFGLNIIFQAMKNGFDVFTSAFVEEVRYNNGGLQYVSRNKDSQLIHGKVFRRTYLIDNDILWNDAFEISGDTYFLGLALRINKHHTYCSTPFYMWKWNQNSVCRREKNHSVCEFGIKTDVIESLIDELLRRGMREDAEYYALLLTYDAYHLMISDAWENQSKPDRDEKERKYVHFYKKFSDMIESAPKAMKVAVARNAKNSQFVQGNYIEKMTYDDWLKRLLKT